MRPIDADALKRVKFMSDEDLPTNTPRLAIYRAGWNDAIDAIMGNAPTVEMDKEDNVHKDKKDAR